MSAMRSRSIPDYLFRRLARIAPGFWVASLVGFAILGPLAGRNASNFFTDQNWKALIFQAFTQDLPPFAQAASHPILRIYRFELTSSP
jgi:peptidoglycan/LPS O-acetylase OafA/YrhL